MGDRSALHRKGGVIADEQAIRRPRRRMLREVAESTHRQRPLAVQCAEDRRSCNSPARTRGLMTPPPRRCASSMGRAARSPSDALGTVSFRTVAGDEAVRLGAPPAASASAVRSAVSVRSHHRRRSARNNRRMITRLSQQPARGSTSGRSALRPIWLRELCHVLSTSWGLAEPFSGTAYRSCCWSAVTSQPATVWAPI
jgi:hypothetical protein